MTDHIEIEILLTSQNEDDIRGIAERLRGTLGAECRVATEVRQPEFHGGGPVANTRAVGAYDVITVVVGVAQLAVAGAQLHLALRQMAEQRRLPQEAVIKEKNTNRTTSMTSSDSVEDATASIEALRKTERSTHEPND